MLLIWWDGSSPKAPSCVVTFSPTCTYACFFFFFFLVLKRMRFGAWCIEEVFQSAKLGSRGVLSSLYFHITRSK